MKYYIAEAVFIVSFLAFVYFTREAIRIWRSPEMQRDLARLRENRRLRRSASRWQF